MVAGPPRGAPPRPAPYEREALTGPAVLASAGEGPCVDTLDLNYGEGYCRLRVVNCEKEDFRLKRCAKTCGACGPTAETQARPPSLEERRAVS
jgi:hypothetical protein